MEASIYQNRAVMKPIILAASLIGTVQATVWTMMSIMAIVTYNIDDKESKDNLSLTYSNIIYQLFLVKGRNNIDMIEKLVPASSSSLSMDSDMFIKYAYVYFLASIVWLVSSFYTLLRMINNAWSKGTRISTTIWSILTIIISILDVVLMSIFVSDYINIDKISLPKPARPETETAVRTLFQGMKTIFLTVYGIMTTAAARGYALWIVNFTFAIILATFSFKYKQNQGPRRSLINAYGASPRAFNLYEQTDIGNNGIDGGSKINSGFVADEDPYRPRPSVTMTPRSPSYQPQQQNALNNDLRHFKFQTAPAHSIDNNNERLAKIGSATNNGGRRTPPQHVESPSVPTTMYNHNEPRSPYHAHGYDGHNNLPKANHNLPMHQTVPHPYTNPNIPHIPEPDYDYNTPPRSPMQQHKSALKTRSNYRY